MPDLYETEVLGLMPGSVTPEPLDFEKSKASQLFSVGQYWAIEDSFRTSALAILENLDIVDAVRLQNEFLAEQRSAQVEADAQRKAKGQPAPKPYQVIGKTAVIPVRGPMTKKPTSASFLVGGASTIRIGAQLRAIEKDPDIENVLMVFETPGGECRGLAELADQIRATNTVKPITSYLDDQCASAGYMMASQTSQIFMNRMGMAGCIGTLAVIEDYSAAAAMKGIRIMVFKSDGATFKGAGTEGTQITPEHAAMFQEVVNHYGDDFKATVQMGRALSDEQINAAAIGKMFNAKTSMEMGLIDGVCSLEECLSKVSVGNSTASPTAGTLATTPAQASSASAKESPMTLKEIIAWARGTNPEAADALTALEATIATPAPVTAVSMSAADQARIHSLEQRLANADNAALQASAEAFFAELTTPDAEGYARSLWASRDGIISTFQALAKVDGNGSAQFGTDNKLIVGASLKGFMDSQKAIPFDSFSSELLKAGNPAGNPVAGEKVDINKVTSMLANSELSEEAKARMLARIKGGA